MSIAVKIRVMLIYLFSLFRWSPAVCAEIGTDGYQRLSASSWGRGLTSIRKYFWSQQVANNVIFSFRNFLHCQNIHHSGYFDVLSGRLFLVWIHLKAPGSWSSAFFPTANWWRKGVVLGSSYSYWLAFSQILLQFVQCFKSLHLYRRENAMLRFCQACIPRIRITYF